MEAILRKAHDKIQSTILGTGGGAKFFSTARRGEGAELQADLNSADLTRQKNAVKRIIANMTLGRDVSFLFVDVVKLGQTPNLELKKLVYLYVLSTAKLQPDKALLAVNTFLQDTTNPSPIVRALAIRTMMCVRVQSVLEYTLEPLRRAVVDADPYVRKTAALGLGKLFHHDMQLFYDQGFVDELMKLLHDSFPVVASNAAAVVSEVNDYGSETIEISSETANRIIFHLSESTEWGQQYILDLLATVRPKDTESAETLVARVLPRLGHTNPSVVMGAIKVIANIASRCQPESIERYTARINSALLTLAKGDAESQYVVCKNIHGLLVVFPNLLRTNLDAFFVRFNDPPYVKLEKLRLLLKLVTPSSAAAIVKELAEYSNEVDLLFVEEVVRAIASLAIKVESIAMDCANLLMNLVTRRAELLPQVVTAAKNIVRKYPELLLLEPLLTQFGAESVVEEEAKVSLVWMLGEYCDFIASGKDILRQFVQTIHTQEQPVQLAVLNAVVKVFLRNPEEMEGMLYEVVQPLAQHSEDPDVRDRALAYWRLLSSDLGLDKVKTMVLGQPAPVNVDRTFSDAMTMADLKKSINTAAVVFGKPYQSFLPPYGLADRELDVDEDDEEDEDGAGAGEGQTTPPMGPQPTAAAATGGTEAAAGPSGAVAPAAPPKPSRDFLDDLFGNASPPAGAGGAAPFVQPVGGPSASSPFAPPPLAPGAGPSAFSSSAMPSSAAGPYGVSGYAPTSPPYPSMGSGLGQQMAPPQGVFGAPQGVPPAPPTAAPNAANAAPPPTSLDSLFS